MDVIKTYIPKRYRSKKLVNSISGSVGTTVINSGGSELSPSAFVDSDTFYSMFEYDAINDAIKAKKEFYSIAGITAYGTGTVGGGGGTGVTVYNGLDSTDISLALSAAMGKQLNDTKLNSSAISAWALASVKPVYAISEITGLSTALAGKADATHQHTISQITDFAHVHQWSDIENKPSVITNTTASFTTALETKLNGIATGAEVNVNADWNAITGDAQILNKPTTLSGYGITDAYTKSQTDNAINNIQVGGRNLVRGSAFIDLSQFTDIGANVSIDATNKINGLNSVKSIQSGLSDYGFRGLISKISAKTGDTFALTIYSFTDNISSFDEFAYCEVMCFDGNGTRVFPNGTTIDIKPTVNNVWQKNTSIFTITATNVVEIWVQPYVAKNGRLWFGGIKLERGNKATDWTPAPEDQISDWLTTDVNSFSYIKNKPTTLSGYGITDAYTKTYTDATYLKLTGGTLTGNLTAPTFIGALTGNAATATKLSSSRTFALTGDVTGTITSDLTSGFSIVTTIAPNSVALGTDTTGNYAGSVGVSGNGLTITGTAGEGTTFTVNSNATSLNTASTLVFRDASGNFSAGTITAQTDILIPFYTWSNATDRNSLKKFLELFDLDTAGNLVVKRNLYSTGEITAYSSGTGVSGLKLMGDLNANEKNIIGANHIYGGNAYIGNVGAKIGLHEELIGSTIAAFDENDYNYYFANNKLIYDNTNNIFSVTGQVTASEFKFGNYSFKQSANGLSICFNGVEQAYITNTGQYVNS